MDRMGAMVCTAAALCLRGGRGKRMRRRVAAARGASRERAERLDFGVVGVSARIGDDDVLGSGFVIDGERGLVLTAAHAVWGARSLKLATGLGVLHGRIVARAPCDDLALLEIHPRIPGLAALPTAPAGSPGRQLLRSLGRRQADATGEGDAVASIPVRATATAAERVGRAPAAGHRDPARLAARPRGLGRPGDRPGRPARRHGPGHERAARSTARPSPCRGRRSSSGSTQLQPGPRSVYVGWASQYRCVGRQHAYARATHPGLPAARRAASTRRSRRPGCPARKGWTADVGARGQRAGRRSACRGGRSSLAGW